MPLNTSSFRRQADPLILPVSSSAQQYTVPANYFSTGGPGLGATSFMVVNPNNFWVRLKGSGDNRPGVTNTASYTAVTATTGWLFPPGYVGVFATQFPVWMSTMSVDYQGLGTGSGTLEIYYGGGN